MVGFLALERAARKKVEEARKKLDMAIRNEEPQAELRLALKNAEAFLKKVNQFLSRNHLAFVLYAAEVQEDGQVIGLDLNAEKRLYIEANALNSRAAQEEIVKYEAYSPVIVVLVELRHELTWMGPDSIESDSKSLSAKSPKVFTLSALAKAVTWSLIGNDDPIRPSTDPIFDPVRDREDFAREYWAKVGAVFGPRWTATPPAPQSRSQYMADQRAARNVAFSSIFLEALGKIGFLLGQRHEWDATADLSVLDRLGELEYNPERDPTWRSLMMKEGMKTDEHGQPIYVFNNVRDSVVKTFRHLVATLGVDATDETEATITDDVEGTVEAA